MINKIYLCLGLPLAMCLGLSGIKTHAASVSNQSSLSVDLDKLEQVISKAKDNLLRKKIVRADNQCEYWSLPAYLGTHFISQYYLLSRWLGIESSAMNKEYLLNLILSKQNKSEGFWFELDDENLKRPNSLDASLFHYWALKVLKTEFPQRKKDIDQALTLAKSYILKNGGADKSVLFTKIIMALFGNYSWDNIIYVPSTAYSELVSPLVVDQFSQWVIPHMRPIGYIRAHRITKSNLGSEFSLSELFIPNASITGNSLKSLLLSGSLKAYEKYIDHGPLNIMSSYNSFNWKKLVEKDILQLQRLNGSWGGYTLATLFSLITIDHYYNHSLTPSVQEQYNRGVEFLEQMYFKTGASAYKGVLDDGRYWDTALAIRALRENGLPDQEIQRAAECLASTQQESGAFPFGEGFETYSDIDDTVETILALKDLKLKKYDEQKALDFVYHFQNEDHGWGTFDANNVGNFLLKIFSSDFSDSAELFDISRPDVTGHALEVTGLLNNKNILNSQKVVNAIKYLDKTRVTRKNIPNAWLSRWGVNYIFGSSAVITGLRAVGVSKDHPRIQETLKFFKAIKNSDGSFGESTESYKDPSVLKPNASVGTASQTAWALMALSDAGEAHSKEASEAVNFLIRQFERNSLQNTMDNNQGFWSDPSVTGTGHPGLFYMVYPIYPYAWPLIALGNYMRKICNDGNTQISSHSICRNYLIKNEQNK